MYSATFLRVCVALMLQGPPPNDAKMPPFLCLEEDRPQALCLNAEPPLVQSTTPPTHTVGGKSSSPPSPSLKHSSLLNQFMGGLFAGDGVVLPSNWNGRHNDCQLLANAHPGKTIQKLCCSAKLKVDGDTDRWGFFRVSAADVSDMC
ncbi:hypothetical protein PtB15_15B100 [Puccinia triticina]|nr:hypothetical protein PtB15_15B100 [Puccinia triticina]